MDGRALRTGRQHQDPWRRARPVHRQRRPARAAATRPVRAAAQLPGLGAFRRPRPLRHPGHRRRRVHEHEHQDHGRGRPQAARRRAAHPGHAVRVHPHLRHARHPRQRSAAAVEPTRTPPSSTSTTSTARTCSTRSCSSCGRRRRPVRSRAVLQLRPYLLGEGQAMQYSFQPADARTRVPRLPLRPPDDYLRDAMVATLANGTSSSTSACRCRPTVPHADRGRGRAVADPALAARAGGAAADPAADVRLARPDRLRARLPTTPGTASPSTARSETRAGPGTACTGSCRRLRQSRTTSSTTSPPATRCSSDSPVRPARIGSAPRAVPGSMK